MGAPLCSRAVGAGGNWYWCWPSPGARDSTMSPGRDLGSGRGSGTPCPLLPVRRPERDWPAISGGYRIAVEGHRWRPADEQERSRLTRIAVDRGAEPQTVRVISAPLILDGPGRPGAGRSSSRCCAVMVVTRLKDAAAAVSRICGRGSPIPISAQVRGILVIVGHRCAAAIGSAHRRAPRCRRSVPSGPGPTAWWSLVIDSTCQVCATRPHLSLLTKSRRTPTVHIPRHTPTDRACPPIPGPPPTRPGTFRAARRVSLRPGHSTPSGTAIPSPGARDAPSWKKVSPHTQNVPRHASELSVTRRTLVAPNAARLPLSRGHRCPRMATDSTTTADTTFIRAALRAIVTIGDS